MNLRQLRSIAEIMRQGSFAAAGDRIGLSHSAISVQMQQLENSLGLELFDDIHVNQPRNAPAARGHLAVRPRGARILHSGAGNSA